MSDETCGDFEAHGHYQQDCDPECLERHANALSQEGATSE